MFINDNGNKMKNNIVLLLTGTITPQVSFKMTARDPSQRLSEYVKSIEWYLKNTSYKIVFGENSGFVQFKEELGNVDENRFEFICFKDEKLIDSAGYQEWEILKQVKDKSKFIKDASIIIKGTGRLILTNINCVMRQFKLKHRSVFCGHYAPDFQSMTTTFFVFTPDLFDDLISIQDDILIKYVEISIMNFVHKQIIKDPHTVLFFNHPLFISGQSGHYGTIYDTPFWKKPVRYFVKLFRIAQWHQTKRKFMNAF